jgi:hypothetical protein
VKPNRPPQNLHDVADQLDARGLHHEAQAWRDCAAQYEPPFSPAVRETIFEAGLLIVIAVLAAIVILPLFGA